jgi:hypothetical protein
MPVRQRERVGKEKDVEAGKGEKAGGMGLLGSSVSPGKGLGDEFILQGLSYHRSDSQGAKRSEVVFKM